MSNQLTRKDFLKGAAAGTLAAALTGAFAGSVLAEEKGTYTPGTYSATAVGMGTVTVTMTFDAEAITDVQVDVSEETPEIGGLHGEELAAQVLAAQDSAIDGVAGASITSDAVRLAAAACIAQAKGETVVVSEEAPAEEAVEEELGEPTEFVDADAVIVGCGAAGIHAALTLAAAGKKTILLEKGASCGVSNGAVAGGPALAETRVQAEEDATVSIKTLYECEYGFSRGTVDGALLRKCTEKGEAVVSNFMDNGVPMRLRIDAYGMGFRARHNFQNEEGVQQSGEARFQPLVDKFEADGGELHLNREAVKLVKDGDAVTGVIAKNTEDGTVVQYNAKAILISTGGYAGNDKRLREIYGNIEIWPLCNILSTGQGFDMVMEAGGIAERNWALCCNEFGGANHKIPDKNGAAMAFASQAQKFAIYGGLIVDMNGDRFMNEQYLSDRPLALGGEMALRAGKYYAVVDEEMFNACRDKGVLEYYGNPADWYVGQTGLVGVVLDKLDADMEAALSQEWAVKGSLADCAAFFGLTNLEETVAAYNALAEAGEDSQFYKDSYLLKALTGDTFYVVEYEPSIWSTFGGVKTDSYCRALTAEQKPIPGLYVAGVDNGSLYCSPYYENEGASLGVAYESGIVAGEYMITYLDEA
ncbi:MAG: FAD-dependent oxidoreductase [Blautia sp.]|nr:FAD-dependent oxidoreductase [Blautia sp.]